MFPRTLQILVPHQMIENPMPGQKPVDNEELMLGVTASAGVDSVTARRAGGMKDLHLCVSPKVVKLREALQNMTQAINLALKEDFLETDLDRVYKGARVWKGTVQVKHRDYIGLGDGLFATVGKVNKSFQLTLSGPDAGSPEGRELIEKNGGGALSGILNLIGRKLDLLQEFEDKVPLFVEQALDRLEAKGMIVEWHRHEWTIETTFVGLDIILTPVLETAEQPADQQQVPAPPEQS